MSRSDDERLHDIVEATNEMADVVALGIERFRSEPLLQRAAERLLEIIGEAANALTPERRAQFADLPWVEITRLRAS